MTGQTDAEIPETGAIFTFGRSSFADNLPSKFWLKNDYPARVSCGREHSAVITGNGRLLVFGCNSSGQLGLKFKPDVNKPTSLKAFKSEKVTFVACGRDHTIVCTSKDRVYYAGNNQKVQPSRGHSPKTGSFLQLHPFCERAHVKMLSAGCSTSAALTEDGRLFMWGDNSAGQIGLGDELFAAEPREVSVGEAVKWVSCGNRHSAFVTVAGDLYTFGENANGRLGLQVEQLEKHRVPQRVPGILGRVTQVCCGGQHTVVLTGQDVFTFGSGQFGQLGHGTFLFEAPSPKPLQHFHKCGVRQIACGENHTAVITNSGLLYTFGDGRHGKLGLMEENFVNQFSPTLCTQFLKFNVQSVSCGGYHMLVLASPRPASARKVLEKDFMSMENFLLSSCAEIPLKERLIDLAPAFPLSALAARARHREKKLSQEILGETFHKLPRLDSGFLNSSWKMSRNVQTLKDVFNPPSSPVLKSGEFPLPSPRCQSISPLSPALSSKPSSSRSLSSTWSKASASACLTSKPAKLPSPLLSPKSITCTPKKAVPSEKRDQTMDKRAANTEKALSDMLFSLLPPKEPCSPAGPTLQAFIEDSFSAQTEGEALRRQGVTRDEQERESDFSPNTVGKKDRIHGRGSTGKQAFCFDKKQDPYGQTAINTDPLSSSIKKDKTRTRKHRFLFNQENIAKKTIKSKKRPSSLGTANRRQPLWSPGVQKAGTEGKNVVNGDKENVKEKTISTMKLPQRNEVNTSALSDKTSENIAVKTDVKVRQETRVKLTPTKKKLEVKATPAKSNSTRLEPEKQASCGTQQVKVQTKEATPGKHEGPSQNPKAKPDSKSSIKSVNKAAREIKVELANKKKRKDAEESEAKPRLSTKSEEDKVLNPGSKDKKKKKTKASSLLTSHHDGFSTQSPKRAEVLSVSGDKSPQSPHPAGAESLPTEVDRKEAQILKEEKSGWQESLQDAASLLPAVGMTGAAAGFLSEALTSVVSFHSDSDKDTPSLPKTPLRAKRFTKQQEVQSISSTPTHVTSKEMEDSMTEDAPVSFLKGDAQQEDDEGGTKSFRSEDEDGKVADENEKSSGTDADGKLRKTENFVENTEGGESRSSTKAEEESEHLQDEEDQSMEKEEDERKDKSGCHADEEEDAKSDAGEGEDKDSSLDRGKGNTEVSEGAEEEEDTEAEKSSDEGQEEEAGSDVRKDEKDSSANRSEEDEEKEGDTAGSAESEEESDLNEEKEESEEQKRDDDSSDIEVNEMESTEESAGEEDDEEEYGSNEEEAEETSDPENEEEEASLDDEATDDKEEEDGDTTSEEEKEEDDTTYNEEEAKEDDEESEEEEHTVSEEDEEEEEEIDSQEEGETQQTESEDTDEEKEEENDKEIKSDEEDVESEEEEEEEEEEGEEDDEEDEEDEKDGESVEEEEEEVGSEEEEEEEVESEGEEEEVGNEEEEEEAGDEEEEEEVGDEEEEEVGDEEEEEEEEKEEEKGQETEEEEGVEVEEEEKEEEEDKVAKTGKDEAQKPPSLDRKSKQEEAPTPAPRTKQTAVKKKQEDPQQFWNDVLPQYLDIQ